MPRAEHLTRLPSETEALGAALAAALRPGDVVLLHGEMGTGKTTFVRGALRALGVAGPVTSPTFTLGRRYDGGRIPSAHLDLHRLSSLEDEDPGLLDPYVEPDRVAFVEWPDAAGGELAAQARIAARVTLEHAGGDLRRVVIDEGPA
jgi:tRNA threonylcarbamoyladenosine biosynthesis protein TsaE